MNTVHFLRHGQSLFNIGIQGPDPGLTDEGKRQASMVSGEYDLVIVSGFLRTIETLEHSKIKYRERIICELCREIKGESSCDYKHGEDTTPESGYDLTQRTIAFRRLLEKLLPGYPRILVISHACFMQFFLGYNGGIGNCQVIKYKMQQNT